METYFITFNKGGGTVVDWDFTNPIHCITWYNNNGYARSTVWYESDKRKQIMLHRMLLNFPKEIDHINGKRNDNRICNLRSVTRRVNQQNRKSHRDGQLPGASYNKGYRMWECKIAINGKQKLLGYFDTEIKAHKVYMEAAKNVK